MLIFCQPDMLLFHLYNGISGGIMKKIIALSFLLCFLSCYCFSQTANNVTITVEITNVVINGGKVFLAIFSNADEYKKEKPYVYYELEDDDAIISHRLTLPAGEYVMTVCQDANGNGNGEKHEK